MEFRKILALRGPNIWARFPVLEAWLDLGRAALETARRLCLAAVHDQPFDVAGEIETLRELWRRAAPTPETAAILKAAKKRRIPVHSLNGDGLLQLGHGVWRRRLRGTL